MKGVTARKCFGDILDQVSIHTPNEGSDETCTERRETSGVSIHTPNEGSDFINFVGESPKETFQSTLPMKGVTVEEAQVYIAGKSFNPHSQ